MNIFFLDTCPRAAARKQVKQSAIKMAVESAQLLSTALRLVPDGVSHVNFSCIYRATHANHPSSKWVRRSSAHFYWLTEHALELCDMFLEDSGREHGSKAVVLYCAQFAHLFPPIPFEISASDLAIRSTPEGRLALREFERSAKTFEDAVVAYTAFYTAKPYVARALNPLRHD